MWSAWGSCWRICFCRSAGAGVGVVGSSAVSRCMCLTGCDPPAACCHCRAATGAAGGHQRRVACRSSRTHQLDTTHLPVFTHLLVPKNCKLHLPPTRPTAQSPPAAHPKQLGKWQIQRPIITPALHLVSSLCQRFHQGRAAGAASMDDGQQGEVAGEACARFQSSHVHEERPAVHTTAWEAPNCLPRCPQCSPVLQSMTRPGRTSPWC